MYAEGATYRHPSGIVYQRIGGNWKVIERPPAASMCVEGVTLTVNYPEPQRGIS
jgi:hypothetical protein